MSRYSRYSQKNRWYSFLWALPETAPLKEAQFAIPPRNTFHSILCIRICNHFLQIETVNKPNIAPPR